MASPDKGLKIRIEEASDRARIYFTLESAVNALMNSVLQGDIKSYDLLCELKAEAMQKGITIGLDELAIYDLRVHFDLWYKNLPKPIILQRDQARQLFNVSVNLTTGKHFNLNRNFFSVIVKDAVSKGANIIKRVRKINDSSMRVYIVN